MKPGSLVVVKPYEHLIHNDMKPAVKWFPKGDENTPYTIREVDVAKNTVGDCAVFEEGIIGVVNGVEIGLPLSFLREVMGPEELDITALIEEELEVSI